MSDTKYFREVMEIEEYEYTAGPIGTKFLEGLRNGKLVAGRCGKCGAIHIPPKGFCPVDFQQVTETVEIEPMGIVKTFAVIREDFNGNSLREPVVLAFIEFPGVSGGLLHYLKAERPSIGMKVKPKWRAERRGSINDIEYFEPL
ncbi:hypothetical protein GCM10007981_00530 [Thermocladium modestius]|uniref:Cobalt transporter ApaG n=1 Tax=Thermocladium modestius TaxID=62609 RepID=A0A830GV89_9CREN|nr:Zn-ribbon domain-containing OB-fold protein [Thermocladium modestius]GGP18924.1 hypothetical protein GCM10007981_00530 [Thermocladium modestius]